MEEEIEIVSNGVCINIEKLKKIIINTWQSGKLYNSCYNRNHRGENLYRFILCELADFAESLFDVTREEIQKKLGLPGVGIDWSDEYPKSDVRSIGFEVLSFLENAWSMDIEELTTDDIPAILEFLDTPPGKSLEAWDKWEKYWDNLDYPARRKKLLGSAEQ